MKYVIYHLLLMLAMLTALITPYITHVLLFSTATLFLYILLLKYKQAKKNDSSRKNRAASILMAGIIFSIIFIFIIEASFLRPRYFVLNKPIVVEIPNDNNILLPRGTTIQLDREYANGFGKTSRYILRLGIEGTLPAGETDNPTQKVYRLVAPEKAPTH